jgi:hypothetical protein
MENKTGVRHNTDDARRGFRVEIRSGSLHFGIGSSEQRGKTANWPRVEDHLGAYTNATVTHREQYRRIWGRRTRLFRGSVLPTQASHRGGCVGACGCRMEAGWSIGSRRC